VSTTAAYTRIYVFLVCLWPGGPDVCSDVCSDVCMLTTFFYSGLRSRSWCRCIVAQHSIHDSVLFFYLYLAVMHGSCLYMDPRYGSRSREIPHTIHAFRAQSMHSAHNPCIPRTIHAFNPCIQSMHSVHAFNPCISRTVCAPLEGLHVRCAVGDWAYVGHGS
jgi:hypothetical protein